MADNSDTDTDTDLHLLRAAQADLAFRAVVAGLSSEEVDALVAMVVDDAADEALRATAARPYCPYAARPRYRRRRGS